MTRVHLGRNAVRVLLVVAVMVAGWAVPAQAQRTVERPVTLRHHGPISVGPVETGFPIDFVGVIWDEDDLSDHVEHAAEEPVDAHGEVRFRQDGVWGPWIPFGPDGADAPGQFTSGLVGGGDAQAFQVRGLPDHARAPRAVALNTTDGPVEVVGRVPAGAEALGNCKTREEWGADPALMTWTPEFHPAQVMTVHHTATTNDDTDPEATVRAIYEYHAVDNGWGDIGYHYLVDRYGVVYEGRYSGSTSDPRLSPSSPCAQGGDGADFAHEESNDPEDQVVTAAHTGGSNSGNVGVAVLGDFSYHRKFANTPSDAAVESLTDVLAELSHRHGIAADSTVTYTNPVTLESRDVDAISGHRDWKATECPGDNLYAMLPDLRTQVVAKVAAMAEAAPGPAVQITSPPDGATVAGEVPVAADVTSPADVATVEFRLDDQQVYLDADAADGWSFSFDSTAASEGQHRLSAVATGVEGVSGSATIGITVDNVADPEVTVFVVDLDAHTHGKGMLWDAHAVVQVADSNGQSLPDAWVHGTFTGDAISPTDATCQIDLTRCELHLNGLDKRLVTSVTFTVTDVVDVAGPYDPSRNTDPDQDSDGGTTISITP